MENPKNVQRASRGRAGPPGQSTMRTTAAQQGRASSSVTSELPGEFCSQPPNWRTRSFARDSAGMVRVRPTSIYGC
jgi:hypothetical protein